tara:strand:- start:15 stop:602 length:588 start_codon:yes stop_codon:yes gene_type:complete
MKDLSKEQLKLVEDLVHPEKDAFIEWYTDEFGSRHDWKLHDLRNKPKITEETIKNIKQLKSSGLTFDQIRQLIQEQEKKMWEEINEQHWWIEKEDMYEAYKELNEPDANYHKLGWTMRLVDSLEEIEKDKSDKLRRFEFGYKKAVERGDPIDELDDNVKQKIAKYLRASLKKKKRKKSTKKPKKKKQTKKKTKKL